MVYEEEDFQPMQYGYHLNPDISEQRIIGMLREIEEDYQRRTRAKQSKVGGRFRLGFAYLFVSLPGRVDRGGLCQD